MTLDQVKQICKRSADGEGVISIIRSMGLPVEETLIDLRDNHAKEIRDAKEAQLKKAEHA